MSDDIKQLTESISKLTDAIEKLISRIDSKLLNDDESCDADEECVNKNLTYLKDTNLSPVALDCLDRFGFKTVEDIISKGRLQFKSLIKDYETYCEVNKFLKINNLQFNLYEYYLEELELRVRVHNTLVSQGIVKVSTLISFSKKELLNLPNFGAKSLKWLIEDLECYGLTLKD